jgi:hypothetical protein
MQIDPSPTAAASYSRSLIARGCPRALATLAAEILARTDNAMDYTEDEKAVIARAYAHLTR